jgi:hypothetical protein
MLNFHKFLIIQPVIILVPIRPKGRGKLVKYITNDPRMMPNMANPSGLPERRYMAWKSAYIG